MFIDPVVRDYAHYGELVALCDASRTRMEFHNRRIARDFGAPAVAMYDAADFDRVLAETKPDVVLVCTVDATHHDYIIRALRAGCDVVTEKPMTTDAEKCRAIFQAVQETGRNVRVSFNARWGPGSTQVRELLDSGVIGNIHAVHMEYQLNTSHGADYFRRWHAHKEHSGGLLIHKSTHHFDLVNWWIDRVPDEVFSWGSLRFYGREAALKRGDDKLTGYDRYTGSEEAKDDPFALTLEEGSLRELYRDAEAETGYVRDANVFRSSIDIEDTMAVLVKYRGGAVLTYSLVAYSPTEGVKVNFTGDRGRLEYSVDYGGHIIKGESDRETADDEIEEPVSIRIIPMFGEGYNVPIDTASGGHGGADPLMQARIFDPTTTPDPLQRDAGHEQGAASLLIGAAANQSMATGLPVRIDDLCPLPANALRLSEMV
jgi:predicted dehydrogenase